MALHFQTCVRLTPDYWFASNAGPDEGPGSIGSAAAGFHAHARCGPLEQDLAAEPVEAGRASASLRPYLPGRLDKPSTFDQPAEVLLVQMRAEDGLDGLLQLEQRELVRHELEDDRAILDLRSDSPDGRRQDTAMVIPHRHAKTWQAVPPRCGLTTVASCFLNEPGFIEQLEALQHLLFIPGAAEQSEEHAQALRALRRSAGRRWRHGRTLGPRGEFRLNHLGQNCRLAPPPVLPGEIVVPAPPIPPLGLADLGRACERQVSD